MNIAIVSTSLNADSKSRALAEVVAGALQRQGISADLSDLRALPPALCDGRPLGEYPEEYGNLWERLEAADGVIIAMPIYCYSTSGPAKNFVDIVGSSLTEKPVAVISAAGSMRSFLAVRDLMSTLMFEFGSFLLPVTIQVAAKGTAEKPVEERAEEFSSSFLQWVQALRSFVATKVT